MCFTVFERSRFTTLQRNGGCSHELRARSQKNDFLLQKVDMSKKLKNVKNDFFPELIGKLPYEFLHHRWCI